MEHREDYYQILGVDPESAAQEIRAAYRRKALDLHPDRLSHLSEAVRRSAEEEMKKVNRAYETLSDIGRRRRYDEDWLLSNSPPRPVVEPPVIVFRDAEPGVGQTGSFVIRNEGGPYRSIWVSDPDSWVQLTGYASLRADDELPLRVEIAASGREWGRYYTESIAVRLDGVEAAVRVQLRTKPAPASQHTRPAARPVRAAGMPAWASALAWGAAAVLAFMIVSAATSTPESRPAAVQPWSTGSSHFRPPTQQPWSPPFGVNSAVSQPGIAGIANNPVTEPRWYGAQPASPGFQPRSPFQQQGFPTRSTSRLAADEVAAGTDEHTTATRRILCSQGVSTRTTSRGRSQ